MTEIDDKKDVILVQNISDKQLYVKKTEDIYLLAVYRQLADVNIEGIPKIIECIEDEDRLVVIEEYIQGKNLSQIMRETGLVNENFAHYIFAELAQILIQLQRLNPPIIHRDIKPSNIIIDKIGHAHLIDFDAARNLNAYKDEDTRMLGTMYFAAPEQYGFGQSDARTDIYGLGATINYCMTGDKPQAGIAEGKLSKILQKCLMLDAKDRYESANALYRDLMQLERKAQDVAYDNVTDSWKKYLLPGFRKGNALSSILAVVWYLFVAAMSLTLEVTGKDGIKDEGAELVIDRLFLFALLAGSTLWYGNYMNVQDLFPGMNQKGIVKTVLIFAYGFLYAVAASIVMVLLLNIMGIS